jgi:UDP-glucose 4-epimerase
MVDLLIDKGHTTVYSVDNLLGSNNGGIINNNPNCVEVYADISDYHSMDMLFKQSNFKYIFHFAANGNVPLSNDYPFVDFKSNAQGTLNIYNLSLKYGVERIIFASTAAVYGAPKAVPISEITDLNPISNYGLTKAYGEKLAIAYYKTYGLKSSVIRIFNTYGPRQPRYVLYDLIKKLNSNINELEVLGDGEQIRDYAYVADTVNAFYKVMIAENTIGEVYNISGGKPINIIKLIELICSNLKINPKIKYTGKSWAGDIKVLHADISKIKRDIGFSPKVSLEEGLKKSIEWFKEKGFI